MTLINKRMESHFRESEIVCRNSMIRLIEPLSISVGMLFSCLKNKKKIFACGNGGSAAEAQHFVAELLGRFECERHPLSAISLNSNCSTLTAIGNDYRFEEIFARQIRTLGNTGDILIVISSSGNSKNILQAISAAHMHRISVIALTGKGGGLVNNMLINQDVHLCVPSKRTARIQEIHLILLHALCDGIDMLLLEDSKCS